MSTVVVGTAYVGKMKIFGYIAILVGKVMNLLYNGLCAIGIENIGIAIIVLTVLIYTLMLPLTYKQQKFSRLSRKMSPELRALQEKYKGRNDQASQQAMMDEQREIYAKYGISPTGSCIQSFLSILILFPLYRVIYNIPAYVDRVKEILSPAVDGIMSTSDYKTTFDAVVGDFGISLRNIGVSDVSISNLDDADIPNRIVDILYKCSTDNWNSLAETFSSVDISGVQESFNHINNFLSLSITNSPQYTLTHAWSSGNYGVAILAILVPIIAGAAQFLNLKVAPASDSNSDDAMAQQMKTMNYTMPLISIFFAFTLPFGLGIYWISGALIRSLYAVLLNRHFDNVNLDEIIEANKEKAARKKKKQGIDLATMNQAARMSTRKIQGSAISEEERDTLLEKADQIKQGAQPNSLAARANLVREFNNRNNK